ncbi:MAG: hypothetical protein ACT4QA_07265 [Panacagrimonas sp.]
MSAIGKRVQAVVVGFALTLGSAAGAESNRAPQLVLKSLEARLGANPFDPASLNNLAVIKLSENDPYAAAELLARALRLAPANRIIADNHKRLTDWLSARLPTESNTGFSEDSQPQLPPEPPPLWPRP